MCAVSSLASARTGRKHERARVTQNPLFVGLATLSKSWLPLPLRRLHYTFLNLGSVAFACRLNKQVARWPGAHACAASCSWPACSWLEATALAWPSNEGCLNISDACVRNRKGLCSRVHGGVGSSSRSVSGHACKGRKVRPAAPAGHQGGGS